MDFQDVAASNMVQIMVMAERIRAADSETHEFLHTIIGDGFRDIARYIERGADTYEAEGNMEAATLLRDLSAMITLFITSSVKAKPQLHLVKNEDE